MASAARHPEAVPGTVHLIDVASGTEGGAIELVPRPSDDPEDPLNWSRRRKITSAIMAMLYVVGVGIPTSIHYSIMSDITHDTGIPIAVMVQGNGVMFLFLGWGCLISQTLALTFGRRGVYLMSLILCVPIMVWTAYSRTTGEWYAHRVLIGLACSPIEALPEVSIPDVFFAHERGAWMALYVFTLFGFNFLAPVIAGFFAEAYGWRWTVHFSSIYAAVTFVVLFFFMEETMYFRNTLEGLEDEQQTQSCQESENAGISSSASPSEKTSNTDVVEVPTAGSILPVQRSYLDKLKFFQRGRRSIKEIFRAMILPPQIVVQFPNVAWAGFIYGINLSWYNVLNGTIGPVLSASPYNWPTSLVGLMYIGPIIGSGLGSLWSGLIADRLTLRLARRNKGIREPEQRLWPLAISAVLSAVGLIIWGVGASYNAHWAVLGVGLIILTFSVVTGGSIALSYNVDCFKDMSGESTISVIITRNTIGFAFAYGITPWYTNMGLKNCFIMAGFLSFGCTATFLLMMWKGKALRRMCAQRYWRFAEKSLHAKE